LLTDAIEKAASFQAASLSYPPSRASASVIPAAQLRAEIQLFASVKHREPIMMPTTPVTLSG
jgi:hypothetical protein